jgi:hypothetical protein
MLTILFLRLNKTGDEFCGGMVAPGTMKKTGMHDVG